MRNEYRFRVKVGDKVVLPNGTPGIIKSWDIICAGHAMIVYVRPITTWWRYLWLFVTCQLRFYEEQIDALESRLLAQREG